MGPAVDRDALDVAVEVEARLGQHPTEVRPDLLLVVLELSTQHPVACLAELLFLRRTDGLSIWAADHLQDTRIVGRARVLVATHAHWEVHQDRLVHVAWRHRQAHADLVNCPPVLQADGGIDQRSLRLLSECRRLILRQVRNDVRNHHVVARHHDAAAADLIRPTVADVLDQDLARTPRIAFVMYVHDRAVEPDAGGVARPVESRVVEPRQDELFGVVARPHLRDQLLHQRPRDPGVAVGKMMNVGMVRIVDGDWREPHRPTGLRGLDAHQIRSRPPPVQPGVPRHPQDTGIVDAEGLPEIVEVGMRPQVVGQLVFRHIDQVHPAVQHTE